MEDAEPNAYGVYVRRVINRSRTNIKRNIRRNRNLRCFSIVRTSMKNADVFGYHYTYYVQDEKIEREYKKVIIPEHIEKCLYYWEHIYVYIDDNGKTYGFNHKTSLPNLTLYDIQSIPHYIDRVIPEKKKYTLIHSEWVPCSPTLRRYNFSTGKKFVKKMSNRTMRHSDMENIPLRMRSYNKKVFDKWCID